jgi:membrane protease YdiL (CAAX protease family)
MADDASGGDQVKHARNDSRVAAPWHTVLVIAILAAWACRGVLRAAELRSVVGDHRVGFYAQTIAAEWTLLGVVLLGVWLHKGRFSSVLGRQWNSVEEAGRDFGMGLLFWLGSTVVLAITASLLRSTAKSRDVEFLLPHGGTEKLIWIAVSISAGICEEAVFRGYLQQQFLALTRSAPAAIAISGILFGLAHAYQGWRGGVVIGTLGLMLGTLAHWRGTVRTGMIAHAWQDSVAGLLGGLMKH